jgi:hypothetical protein
VKWHYFRLKHWELFYTIWHDVTYKGTGIFSVKSNFLPESSSDQLSKSEQFDDAQERNSSSEAIPDQSLQEGISSCNTLQDCSDHTTEPTSYSSPLTAEAVNMENSNTVTLTKDLKPKKSVRRNRNALLNSLANYRAVADADIQSEMKTNIQVQDHTSSFDYSLNCTDNISDHFKSGMEVPLRNQVGRTNVNDFKKCIKNTDSNFQFREDDFPPL